MSVGAIAPVTAPGLFLRRSDAIAIAWILLAALATQTPALSAVFANGDDYVILLDSKMSRLDLSLADNGGRILQGVLIRWAFSLADSVQELLVLRLIAAALTGLCGIFIYRHLRIYALGPLGSALTSSVIVASPSFLLFSSFVTTAPSAVAVVASYPAWLAIHTSTRTPWTSWKSYAGLATGVGLIIISLYIYQPAALFVAFWTVAWMVSPRRGPLQRGLVTHALAIGGALVLYYLSFKGFFPGGERTDLDLDPVGKLSILVTRTLPIAAQLNVVFSPLSIAPATLLGAALAIAFAPAGNVRERLLLMGGVLAMLAAAYAANIVTYWGRVVNFRTLVALSPCLTVLAAIGYTQATRARDIARPLRIGVAAMAAVALIATGGYANAKYVVDLLADEYSILQEAVATRLGPQTTHVEVIKTAMDDPRNFMASGEFGVPSSMAPASWRRVESMLQLAAQDVGVDISALPISIVDSGTEQAAPPPGALRIDLSVMSNRVVAR